MTSNGSATNVAQVREPAIAYARNAEIPTFFGQPMLKGAYAALDPARSDPRTPTIFYSHPGGEIWLGDAALWLRSLANESADLIFADPPYNIGKAEWDTFESQQAYVVWSLEWIEQAARVLEADRNAVHLWFFRNPADLRLPASRFFRGCRWLVWHYKNKANLGNDWGRSHESILHFRKSRDFTFNTDDVRIPYGNHTLEVSRTPAGRNQPVRQGERQRPPLASSS